MPEGGAGAPSAPLWLRHCYYCYRRAQIQSISQAYFSILLPSVYELLYTLRATICSS